ncbi:MAG TPA: RNA methyltransferase [Planctomycetota bacterium]|nr:RNA methyltransferase [Planctomycetota bacterium]
MSEHLEGKQCILSALRARQRRFELVLVSWSAHRSKTEVVIQLANQLGVPVKIVSPDEMDKMSKGKTHAGLLAITSAKPLTNQVELLQMVRDPDKPPFFLLLEGIEDEQNLGFIIRTAGAMGVDAVLIKKHIWNFDQLAVSRASAGVYEWMPLVKIERESELLPDLKKSGLKVLGALPKVKRTMYDMDFKLPIIVALGGEKRGLSGALRQSCDRFFTIPMNISPHNAAYGVPSLSLSHSGAIVMAEVMRQRRG